jgi:hypothetical protein
MNGRSATVDQIRDERLLFEDGDDAQPFNKECLTPDKLCMEYLCRVNHHCEVDLEEAGQQ